MFHYEKDWVDYVECLYPRPLSLSFWSTTAKEGRMWGHISYITIFLLSLVYAVLDMSGISKVIAFVFFLLGPVNLVVEYFRAVRIKHKVLQTTVLEEEKKEKAQQKDIADKRESIISIVDHNIDKAGIQNWLKQYEEHQIDLQDATRWYVENGFFMEGILLTRKFDDVSITLPESILETEKAKEDGLLDDYYVICKERTQVFCCNSKNGRVYAFSKQLGVTNTPYLSFYEFILKYGTERESIKIVLQ